MVTTNELSLDFLLDKTFFKDYKMTISSMESWGVLRRDLISALGTQRAKRFLIRNGWNSGKKEAQMFKKSVQWKDKYDWLIAGTKMHALTGRVISYPETFHVDMDKGEFNVSGYWIDSYEAEQHLKYFSHYHEPICYYLVGYAGGYTSECVGKTIIFKELTCKGMQDSYCSYQGKTLEAWGDEIAEELIYYEDADMSDELDRMYRAVEQQKEAFKIGSSLNRELTDAMLEGKGLKEFVQIFGELTKLPVAIENKHLTELASYCKMPGIDGELTARHLKAELDDIVKNRKKVVTPLQNKTFSLATVPIMIKGENFGFVTTIVQNENDQTIINLIERLAAISALYIQNERIAIETEERLTGDLLDQLLNDKSTDIHEINERFSLLGYDLEQQYYVLFIEVNNQKGETNQILSEQVEKCNVTKQIKETINRVLKEDIDSFGTHSILKTSKRNHVKVLISKQKVEEQNQSIIDYAETILKRVGEQKMPVYIGISDYNKNITDFNKMVNEAQKAIELGKIKTSDSTIVLSSELGHLSLLLNARSPQELETFAIQKLKPIIDYDEENDSALLNTLYSYSQNEFNLHKTARNIHISISGMRYRIQKIEELLDKELSDSNFRFEIQLALSTLYVIGKNLT